MLLNPSLRNPMNAHKFCSWELVNLQKRHGGGRRVPVGERISANQCLLWRNILQVFGIHDWIQAVDSQVDDAKFGCYPPPQDFLTILCKFAIANNLLPSIRMACVRFFREKFQPGMALRDKLNVVVPTGPAHGHQYHFRDVFSHVNIAQGPNPEGLCCPSTWKSSQGERWVHLVPPYLLLDHDQALKAFLEWLNNPWNSIAIRGLDPLMP